MDILFTKSELIGSQMIRAVTGEDCSHCAIHHEGLILHASFGGVQEITIEQFTAEHSVLHTVPIKGDINTFLDITEKYRGNSYDYWNFLVLGIRCISKKFGLPFPKINLWNSSGAFLCTELVSAAILGKKDTLITPHQLYTEIKKEFQNVSNRPN